MCGQPGSAHPAESDDDDHYGSLDGVGLSRKEQLCCSPSRSRRFTQPLGTGANDPGRPSAAFASILVRESDADGDPSTVDDTSTCERTGPRTHLVLTTTATHGTGTRQAAARITWLHVDGVRPEN